LSYGIGHGGIESIVIVALPLASTLLFILNYNEGQIEEIKATLQGNALLAFEYQISILQNTPSNTFLISGMERVFSMIAQLSLSMIVFFSISIKGKWYLFFLAIFLHSFMDLFALSLQVGFFTNLYLVEIMIGLSVLVIFIIAKSLHKSFKDNFSISSQNSKVYQIDFNISRHFNSII
jgi:uncharacterized membrane protein YhfC